MLDAVTQRCQSARIWAPMSALSISTTVAIENEWLPNPTTTSEEISELLERRVYDESNEYRYLFSFSRNGWFECALSDICKYFQIESLRFLSGEAHDFIALSNVNGYGNASVTILDQAKTSIALGDTVRIISGIEKSPQTVINTTRLLNGDGWKAESLIEAVKFSPAYSKPSENAKWSDDGDTPWYLISCLKMLMTIFEHALNNNYSVLYTGQPPE